MLEIPDLPPSAAKQREHIERSLARVLRAAHLPVLDVWNGNELIFLLPGGRADAALAARLRQRLREEAGHDGYLGLGGAYQEVVDLRRSLKEARFALRLARAGQGACGLLRVRGRVPAHPLRGALGAPVVL